jgi:hypothetical protein
MEERERQGVTLDVCSRCRGVFLDRGELEKLIALAEPIAPVEPRAASRPSDFDDDDRDHRSNRDLRARKRRGGQFEVIGDVFD